MDRNENEADYAWVHFFFPYQEPLGEGNFYISGKFCDWQNSTNNQLRYNYSKKGYELEIYLKQGFYNYQLTYQKTNQTAWMKRCWKEITGKPKMIMLSMFITEV